MTRGNQREAAREKNLKKQQQGATKKSGNVQQRNESDAAALQAKIAAKAAAKEAEANGTPIPKVKGSGGKPGTKK